MAKEMHKADTNKNEAERQETIKLTYRDLLDLSKVMRSKSQDSLEKGKEARGFVEQKIAVKTEKIANEVESDGGLTVQIEED